jgi:hypothetical protein
LKPWVSPVKDLGTGRSRSHFKTRAWEEEVGWSMSEEAGSREGMGKRKKSERAGRGTVT